MIMEERPQGFRFFPTEEELLCFYLRHKLDGDRDDIHAVIPVVNIYLHSPWNLPQLAGELSRGDPEQCFFFVDMQENMGRGGKPSRLTAEGYWKAAGSPSLIHSPSNNGIIGGKKTMIFYEGRAPKGRKTDWKMNEYTAILGEPPAISHLQLRHEFSLCRIYKRNTRLDRCFDCRPSAPPTRVRNCRHKQYAIPAASRLQTDTSTSMMPKPAAISQSPGEHLHNLDCQNMGNDDFWDVCVPLLDWEHYMGF